MPRPTPTQDELNQLSMGFHPDIEPDGSVEYPAPTTSTTSTRITKEVSTKAAAKEEAPATKPPQAKQVEQKQEKHWKTGEHHD